MMLTSCWLVQVGLTIQEVQRDLLIWDYHSIIRASPGKGLKTPGMKRVPTQFQGLQDYCRVFRVLLLEELKAHLLQVFFLFFWSAFFSFPHFLTLLLFDELKPRSCRLAMHIR